MHDAGVSRSIVVVLTIAAALVGAQVADAAPLPGSAAMVTPIPGPGADGVDSQLTPFGGGFLFDGHDGAHGIELWRTDGTPAGTALVADLVPGEGSSLPGRIIVVGSSAYFIAYDTDGHTRLCVTDGTTAGTRVVADAPANARFNGDGVAVGSRIFFSATDPDHGAELWTSDGSAAGTTLVSDIAPGTAGSRPQSLTAYGSRVYFTADDGSSGRELWSADASGAARVADIASGSASSSPHDLALFNGKLYFGATDGAAGGDELYVSDGTGPGTGQVANINGTGDATPQQLTPVGNQLFFTATDGATFRRELWHMTTTSAPSLVKDLTSGTASSGIEHMTAVGTKLDFVLDAQGYVHQTQVWTSDGTSAGTIELATIGGDNPADTSFAAPTFAGSVTPLGIGQSGVFTAHVPSLGDELWATDGTPAGTKPVTDIWAGSGSGRPYGFAVTNGIAYFSADDRTHGPELWRSDGTAAGTALAVDVNTSSAGAFPRFLSPIGSNIYFSANSLVGGDEPWRSDGTAAGTVALGDTEPGPVPDQPGAQPADTPWAPPNGYTPTANGVVFAAYDGGDHGRELWRLDPGGPVPVKDLAPGVSPYDATQPISGSPTQFTIAGGAVYFTSRDLNSRYLWRTDGTTAGTVQVAQVQALSPQCCTNLTAFGDALLYDSNVVGQQGVYRLDPGATTGVKIFDGTVIPYTGSLVAHGTTAWFAAADASGTALWRTDGTQGGTTKVADVPRYNGPLVATASGVFFAVDQSTSSVYQHQIYHSDGTAAGTGPIGNPLVNYGEAYTAVGDGLLFRGSDNDHGVEPWISDGTAAGTHLLADLAPGTADSFPSPPAEHQGHGFFWASDGHQSALWQTDGTADGTVAIPGTANHGTGGEIVSAGSILYFLGSDPVNGSQLWRFPAPEPPASGPTATTPPVTTTPPIARAPIPTVSSLQITPAALRTASSGGSVVAARARHTPGAIVSYRVNVAATVRFTVARLLSGRRAGKRCVTTTAKNRRRRHCTRAVALRGSFTRTPKAGSDRFRFTGRVAGHALGRGRYLLIATPLVGKVSGTPATARFAVSG